MTSLMMMIKDESGFQQKSPKNLSISPEFIFHRAHPKTGRVPALIPIEILACYLPDVLYDVSTRDTNNMFRLMFKHRANDKQIDRGKYKRQKRKWHRLTPSSVTNAPTLGATKPRRKSTSVVLVLSSQQTPSLQLIT
ncbi:hypothetical protein MTR_7g029230 [Medicago truncatula]|uniref:Uncharacterized protein n=1 Tax=Medicago truncatula TaxID=3880 RepID=A0A072TX73_MEDTR|nr:hypothetical protein MTR_7g029230 [Medicago truncatula]